MKGVKPNKAFLGAAVVTIVGLMVGGLFYGKEPGARETVARPIIPPSFAGGVSVSDALGISVANIRASEASGLGLSWPARGVLVDCVISKCLGSQAGLAPDDVVVALNDQPVFNKVQFWSLMASHTAPDLTIEVVRGERLVRLSVPRSAAASAPASCKGCRQP
jgi:S1-C subfamily serine protease